MRHPSRRLLTVLLTVLTPVLMLAGCGGLGGTGDLDYVAGESNVTQIAVDDRDGALDLSGETLDGDDLSLADLRGDVVVVNVWGSWCSPCRQEAPLLTKVAGSSDAKFVGIDIRDSSRDNALAFEREFATPYPSLYDPGSETLLDLGRKYAGTAVPSTFVLDRDGRIAAVISGAVPSSTTLTEVIEDVAAEDG